MDLVLWNLCSQTIQPLYFFEPNKCREMGFPCCSSDQRGRHSSQSDSGQRESLVGWFSFTYYIILFSLQGLDWGSHLRRSWWRGNVSRYTIPFTPGLREISTICNCFTSLKRKYIFIPFSALNVVVSAWAPPQERFRLIWSLSPCSHTLKMRRFNLYSGLSSIFLTLDLTIATLANWGISTFLLDSYLSHLFEVQTDLISASL